jgi:putative ABC transport system substrate-binding protein
VGLAELGYVEGQNITIEYRYVEGGPDEFLGPATELVQRNVDVLVTAGGGVRAAVRATSSIPIVFAAVTDPVGTGLIDSYARPGRNVTGLTTSTEAIDSKRLDLIREAIPGILRIGQLWDPETPPGTLASTAQAAGLEVMTLAAQSASEFEPAFASARAAGAQAVVMLPSPAFVSRRSEIIRLADTYRLPAIYGARDFVLDGGLMAYGQSNSANFRRAATYVDRILRGANPSEIPVEQSTTFELFLNVRTAAVLGPTFPQSVLGQATEIVQ